MKLSRFLEGKGFVWLAAYSITAVAVDSSPVVLAMLGLTIISLAFTIPNLSSKMLRGNDVSYGVYIYHMPIINTLIYLNLTGIKALSCALLLIYALALFSWYFVEMPALRLKKNPLHPVSGA